MVSSLGGALSLYLGISVAMLFEVVEFGIDLLIGVFRFCNGGKIFVNNNKIIPTTICGIQSMQYTLRLVRMFRFERKKDHNECYISAIYAINFILHDMQTVKEMCKYFPTQRCYRIISHESFFFKERNIIECPLFYYEDAYEDASSSEKTYFP